MDQYKTGDTIEHHLMPGFTMAVLDTRDCETDGTRPEPHLAYKVTDPEGNEDWLCAYDARRVSVAPPATEGVAWRLEGYDTFAGEEYPLGNIRMEGGGTLDGMQPSYPDYDSALADARRRLEDLERTQPSASSGGQSSLGIQDRVYIVHPDGRRERVYPPVTREKTPGD